MTAPLFAPVAPDDLARVQRENAELRKRLGRILDNAGTPTPCRGCGAPIVFIHSTKTGKNTPYDTTGPNFGDSHFKACPEAKRFSGRNR